jgi:kynurenine formamidase
MAFHHRMSQQMSPTIVDQSRFHDPLGWMHRVGVVLSGLVVLVCLVACGSLERRPPASGPRFEHVLDLTHTLDSDFPYIPVPGITFPFALEPIATLANNGVAANRWRIHEHLGTQIDAPNHFAQGGRALEQLRTDELIVPVIVIDISARAATDADTTLTVADIERWEAQHGRVPKGACVMMNSGWQRHLHEPQYLGRGAGGLHFPGISAEAAQFLVRERNIWGVGVDTISFDPGMDHTYRTHRVLLGADKWALEAVANLDRLPPVGATLFIGATKVRGATGGPVRLIAVW